MCVLSLAHIERITTNITRAWPVSSAFPNVRMPAHSPPAAASPTASSTRRAALLPGHARRARRPALPPVGQYEEGVVSRRGGPFEQR